MAMRVTGNPRATQGRMASPPHARRRPGPPGTGSMHGIMYHGIRRNIFRPELYEFGNMVAANSASLKAANFPCKPEMSERSRGERMGGKPTSDPATWGSTKEIQRPTRRGKRVLGLRMGAQYDLRQWTHAIGSTSRGRGAGLVPGGTPLLAPRGTWRGGPGGIGCERAARRNQRKMESTGVSCHRGKNLRIKTPPPPPMYTTPWQSYPPPPLTSRPTHA